MNKRLFSFFLVFIHDKDQCVRMLQALLRIPLSTGDKNNKFLHDSLQNDIKNLALV